MTMFDILAGIAQTYRQHTIFSLEKDDPTVTVSYVEIFYSTIPEYKKKEVKLTTKPEKGDKFSASYNRELTKWIIDNLFIVEKGFSEYLYYRKQMLTVLQSAVGVYRQALLYNLQNNRDVDVAVGMIRIMNVLLPGAARADLNEPPSRAGKLSSMYEPELRNWILTSLKQIELHLGAYVYRIMAMSQH